MDLFNITKGIKRITYDEMPEEVYRRSEWQNVLYAISLGAYNDSMLGKLVKKLERKGYDECVRDLQRLDIIPDNYLI